MRHAFACCSEMLYWMNPTKKRPKKGASWLPPNPQSRFLSFLHSYQREVPIVDVATVILFFVSATCVLMPHIRRKINGVLMLMPAKGCSYALGGGVN